MEWIANHLTHIGLGIASVTLVPAAWYLAKAKLPGILARWVVSEAKLGLQGGGSTDADLQALIRAITLAAVIYAEKKLPDAGMGPQKTDLILNLGRSISWLRPWIDANEANLRELINLSVIDINNGLKGVLPDNENGNG